MSEISRNILISIISFLFASVLTNISIPLVIKIAKRHNILDTTDNRKVKKKSLVRIGGVSIAFGFLLTSYLIFSNSKIIFIGNIEYDNAKIILIGSCLCFILGVIDDIKSLNPFSRLLIQISIATYTWLNGIRIQNIEFPWLENNSLELSLNDYMSFLVTIIWIVGMINCINWVDGIDGLAAGKTIIFCTSLTIIFFIKGYFIFGYLISALSGSCIGFLRLNLFPAKIIMGDGGTYLLGYALASSSLLISSNNGLLNILIPFLIFLVPISDMIYVILNRLKEGKSPFYPDSNHLHHRLLNSGMSVNSVVNNIFLINIISSLIALFLFTVNFI